MPHNRTISVIALLIWLGTATPTVVSRANRRCLLRVQFHGQ